MQYPELRLRRLRRTAALRRFVRDIELHPDHWVYPIFVDATARERTEIASMPGQYRWPLDRVSEIVEVAVSLGVRSFILFGIPEEKDERGSGAWDERGVVQEALRRLRRDFGREIVLIADVCLCEYTEHGHCGPVVEGDVVNDETLELIGMAALSLADAGADIVAPSGMMDGMVQAIRTALDEDGFTGTAIMSYAAKYASAFYGPFRDAADSAPSFGDRRSYQMSPIRRREAELELDLDVVEGADILMVKPALPYLDIIERARERFPHPLAAYQVSGEYAMVKAAAEKGWLDEVRIVWETLTAIHRAGADIILTYYAVDAARWVQDGTFEQLI